MLSHMLPHPSTSALGRPAAENSQHARTAATLHSTDVCCGLNLAASTAAPHLAHSTRHSAAYRSSSADIAPDMVARYEFEIDTTRAVAGWEAEVAANLARQADAG